MCVAALGAVAAAASTATVGQVIGVIGVIGSLASTATSIVGSQEQAKAANKQAEYEYQIAKNEAELERQAGNVEQLKHGINARRAYGLAQVRAARFGSDLSFGSTADRFVELRKFQAFEQDLIKRNADRAVLSSNLRAQEARSRGKNAQVFATYSSIGQAFSGVANVGATTTALYSAGVFGDGGRRAGTGAVSFGGPAGAARLTAGSRF